MSAPHSAATTLRTLYRFCSESGGTCTDGDGSKPAAGVIMGSSGNLFGTTKGGGSDGLGTVYELTLNAVTQTWTEKILHSFCSQFQRICTDGAYGFAGVITDMSGNLYGTTYGGGAHNHGTVFELTPNSATGTWTEKVLYSFKSAGTGDALDPVTELFMDASGNLYGTTALGGAGNAGAIFELIPDAAKTLWKEKVLYSFRPTGSGDGQHPGAGVTMDASGNLYGTTADGGAGDVGTVFELISNSTRTKWTEKILHSFRPSGSGDGQYPGAGVIIDASGNLYGSTTSGGAAGKGSAFVLKPNAAKTKWTETLLYSFCSQGGVACTDGNGPNGLIAGPSGKKLYGTTAYGGVAGAGTVFELTPSARAKSAWTERVLRNLCSRGTRHCGGGAHPVAIINAPTGLYGVTSGGGADGSGTVFQLTQ